MRDIPASAEQYRTDPEEQPHRAKLRAQDQKLIDAANAVPIDRILSDFFGIAVPTNLSKSWKAHCPFGFEHPDGGTDRAMRVYGSNTAYCFSQHGMMTPVRMVQIQTERRQVAVARLIASRYGLDVGEPYWETAKRLILTHDERQGAGNPSNAVQALQQALNRSPTYGTRQFDPDVTKLMGEQLELLDEAIKANRPNSCRIWMRTAVKVITEALETTDGKP